MNRFEYNRPNTRERLAARRRARSRHRQPAAKPGPRRAVGVWASSGRLFSLMLLIGSLGGLLYVATSPEFRVEDIQVEGAQALPSSQVIDLTAARDTSIWFVDTAQIAKQLEENAYIEHAQIFVSLPNRLSITVTERRPELRWRSGGRIYLLDASGRVLSNDTAIPITNTLVIDDRSNQPLQPNDQVDQTAMKLGQILAMRLPNELHIQPASVGWDTSNGMIVTTAGGQTIIFGRTLALDDKFAILRTLLDDQTPFTLLDLRPNTPFYRNDPPKQTATPSAEPSGSLDTQQPGVAALALHRAAGAPAEHRSTAT